MSLVEQPHASQRPVTPTLDVRADGQNMERDSYTGSLATPPPTTTCHSSNYYEENIIADLDNAMISPQPKNDHLTPSAPALPAKSTLRSSRVLDLSIKADPEEQSRVLSLTTPYDVYLSSEEDASSSADDFSDFGAESESDETSTKRQNFAVTARAVSVIFAGKPSIVEMRRPRSTSPVSIGSRRAKHLSRTATEPILGTARRISITSSATLATLHPPRSSSIVPGGSADLPPPRFLSIDPFAAKKESPEDYERPRTPKTPTGMFKRGLSLVRKKSKPRLNQAAMFSQDNLSVQTLPVEQTEVPREQVQQRAPQEPVSYQDIMKAARARTKSQASIQVVAASDSSPTVTTTSKSRLHRSGISISRPRSIKA